MNSYSKQLLPFFKILADESKYRIILHLMNGEDCVCAIADKLKMEQSLVSHHLNTLRELGLIIDRKVGTWVHCSLNKKKFGEMEQAYQKLFSSTKISDKLCTSHEVCQKLMKGIL